MLTMYLTGKLDTCRILFSSSCSFAGVEPGIDDEDAGVANQEVELALESLSEM